MLMESKAVLVPNQRELDADHAEYGQLSTKVRAMFGEAACEVGSPDYDRSDAETGAVDAIANVLHYVSAYVSDIDRVVEAARMHFEAEIRGDES